jgi:hypothetical protein
MSFSSPISISSDDAAQKHDTDTTSTSGSDTTSDTNYDAGSEAESDACSESSSSSDSTSSASSASSSHSAAKLQHYHRKLRTIGQMPSTLFSEPATVKEVFAEKIVQLEVDFRFFCLWNRRLGPNQPNRSLPGTNPNLSVRERYLAIRGTFASQEDLDVAERSSSVTILDTRSNVEKKACGSEAGMVARHDVYDIVRANGVLG